MRRFKASTSDRRGSRRLRTNRRRAARRLFAETLEPRLLLTTIKSVDPAQNSQVVATDAGITATFDQSIDPATATPQMFAAHAMQSGQLVGAAATVTTAGDTVTLQPSAALHPGEFVQVTATSGIHSVGGQAAAPYIWQFRTAVTRGDGQLLDSAQNLGNHRSRGTALGDLDGDGDLDAFVVNIGNTPNRIWLNESGRFSDSGQLLGDHNSRGIALGDLDGDGDLDAFVTNRFQGNRVWLNSDGRFTDTGQSMGDHDSYSVSLGDVDADGDLDAFIANLKEANKVWLNSGDGRFTDSGQVLGDHNSERASLGDLDGDGDLDAFVGNSHQGNRIWLNTAGVFTDSGQSMGNHDSCGSALGDLDGDGDLDAYVTNSFQGNRIWLNDGTGVLSDTGQILGDHDSWGIALGDLDGDGDLDAFVADFNEGNHIWMNEGGVFSDSGLELGRHFSFDVALGDLDGDGDLDAFVANRDQGNRVWLNRQSNSLVSITARDAGRIEGDGDVTPYVFEVTRVGDTSVVAAVDFTVSGSGAHPADAADFGGALPAGSINFAAGETLQTITINVFGDLIVEEDEEFTVALSSSTPATTVIIVEAASSTIQNDDEQVLLIDFFAPHASGFAVEFNADLEISQLNLYDTETANLGPSDVVLQGASGGLVAGSLVIDSSARRINFTKTGGVLTPDVYTVTLRSGTDGFTDTAGVLLDGDRDGIGGGNFSDTFTVPSPAEDRVTVSIPDFTRCPGQDVNLPADSNAGIPLMVSQTARLRNARIQIGYDPALLTISGAGPAEAMPDGVTVALDTTNPGTAVVTIASTVDLPAGSNVVANLQASVPATDASAIYRRQQVLDIHEVVISDAGSNPILVTADDAVHLVAHFGDVTGNGRINAVDAAQVARVAAQLDTGFVATPLTDPLISADVSGNERINAADASLLAQFAALISVPQIPGIPDGIVAAGLGAGPGLAFQPAAADRPAELPIRGVPTQTLDFVFADHDHRSFSEDELPADLEEALLWRFSALDSQFEFRSFCCQPFG